MTNKTLPQVKVTTFLVDLPISKKTIEYRPYTVADEKVLLAAAKMRDDKPTEYIKNTINVLQGSIQTEGININELPSAEVKLLMLRQRGKSVGEVVEFQFKDHEGVLHKGSLNTDDFFIEIPKDKTYQIELSEDVVLNMRDLTFSEEISYSTKFKNSPTDSIYESIYDSVVSLYDKQSENLFVVGEDVSRGEIRTFIDGLTGISGKLYSFLAGRPKVAIKATIDGEERTIDSDEIDFLS